MAYPARGILASTYHIIGSHLFDEVGPSLQTLKEIFLFLNDKEERKNILTEADKKKIRQILKKKMFPSKFDGRNLSGDKKRLYAEIIALYGKLDSSFSTMQIKIPGREFTPINFLQCHPLQLAELSDPIQELCRNLIEGDEEGSSGQRSH